MTRLVVLDIETVYDREAAALLPTFAALKRRHGRWPLARVAAASMVIVEGASGSAPIVSRVGLHLGSLTERELVHLVEAHLPDPAAGLGELVTFNGIAHDLPILRQRAMALGLFATPRLAAWNTAEGQARHHDVMRRLCAAGAPKVSLVDVAAGLGLSAKQAIQGTSAERLHRAGRHGELLAACEQDAVATLLAYLHLDAQTRGNRDRLLAVWAALARWIQGRGAGGVHLRGFLDHPTARLAVSGASLPAAAQRRLGFRAGRYAR